MLEKYDQERLKLALMTEDDLNSPANIETVVRMYACIDNMEACVSQVPLKTLLEKQGRRGQSNPKLFFLSMSIPQHFAIGELDQQQQMFQDAPLGIQLNYKGKPNAVIRMHLKTPDTMRIQGYASPRGLFELDYRQLMIAVAQHTTKNLGCEFLTMPSVATLAYT